MTKSDRFVLLVQTAILMMRDPRHDSLVLLAAAMGVPEIAIPEQLDVAARDWLAWKTLSHDEPAWLKEYRENITSLVVAEQRDGTDEWWRNAESVIDGATVPKAWNQFVRGRAQHVMMTAIEAKEFDQWAREVPGWSDEDPPVIFHVGGVDIAMTKS